MDPVTMMVVGGALKAGAGVAQGIGTARAAKKMMLTPKEQAELDELERRRRSGDLGLSETRRGGIEQRFLAEQAGAQRQLQAQGLQEAAARGMSGGVSARDLFLSEQAKAQGLGSMRQQQNIGVEELNQAATRDQEAQIEAMRSRQRDAKAMRAQGIAQAVTGGLAGAGDATMGAAQMKQETKLATIQAEAQAQSADSLLNQYNSGGGYFSKPFGQQAPPPTPRRF